MAVQVRPLICQRPRQWTATHYVQVLLVHGKPNYPNPLRPLLQQHHHFLRRQLPLPPGHQGLEHHGRRRRRPGKAGHPVGRGGRRQQPHWVWPYPLWPPLLVAAAGRQETQPLRPHPWVWPAMPKCTWLTSRPGMWSGTTTSSGTSTALPWTRVRNWWWWALPPAVWGSWTAETSTISRLCRCSSSSKKKTRAWTWCSSCRWTS